MFKIFNYFKKNRQSKGSALNDTESIDAEPEDAKIKVIKSEAGIIDYGFKNPTIKYTAKVKCPYCRRVFKANFSSVEWVGPGMGRIDDRIEIYNKRKLIASGGFEVTVRCVTCSKLFNVKYKNIYRGGYDD